MTETRRTSFFALLFFIYFIGVSFLMAYLPLASRLSDSAYMLLSQLICFVPPLLVYFKWSKKNVKETLRLNPLGSTITINDFCKSRSSLIIISCL